MSIQEIQNQIIEEFESYDDWMDKYNLLIDLSKDVPALDPRFKTDQFVIKGCQSRVWLHAELVEGRILFKADSDAIIVKGIVALLLRVFSNQSPQDISSADLYFINRIGLSENLSPTRSNGLLAMVKQMKLYAIAFQSQINKQSAS